MSTVTVPSRFNGPPSSGNGGYACGLVAAAVEGPTGVSLRRPIPLDQALALRHGGDGKVCAFVDEELIIEAPPAGSVLA